MPCRLPLWHWILKPGDEVITPDFTFIATVEVIALLGLKPVLVDVDPGDFTIDMASLKKSHHSKDPGYHSGAPFWPVCQHGRNPGPGQENHLHVIEDNAQAIGADYRFSDGAVKKAGTIGDIGCTSFFPSKNLGCFGDGGALFTNDDELAR